MNESATSNSKDPKRTRFVRSLLSVFWFFFLYLLGIAIPSMILLTGAFGIFECESFAKCTATDQAMPFFSTFGIFFNFIGPAIWFGLSRKGMLPGTSGQWRHSRK